MSRQPLARTLEPEDAHPLHLLAIRWVTLGMQLAGALARSGRREMAQAVEAHVDAGRELVRDLPRRKGER